MSIYLHKILPILVSPIFIAIALIAMAIVFGKKRWAMFSVIFLWVFSMPIVGNALYKTLEQGMVRLTPSAIQSADAIIVLSGMITTVESINGPVSEWGDPDRFFAGLELFEADKAPTLVFTRGWLPWTNQLVPEGEYLKEVAVKFGVPAAQIKLTDKVENTADEALAVAKLFENSKSPKIILVTSAFHMPRAAPLFEKEGFEVIQYPVDFKSSNGAITFMSFLPSVGAFGRTSVTVREYLGRIYYAIKST